jgi:hypothetical protein
MDDELERIAGAEGTLSPEDLVRFRGVLAYKELRLAWADVEEARRAKLAAIEDYERVREEHERVTKDLEAVLVVLDRAEERARRAARMFAGEG